MTSTTRRRQPPEQVNLTRAPEGRRRWNPSINITPVERRGRIVVGSAAVVVGLTLLASAGSVLAVILELLLVAAGSTLS